MPWGVLKLNSRGSVPVHSRHAPTGTVHRDEVTLRLAVRVGHEHTDRAIGLVMRPFDGFDQPRSRLGPHLQAVHDEPDGVLFVASQLVGSSSRCGSVDTRAQPAGRQSVGEFFDTRPSAPARWAPSPQSVHPGGLAETRQPPGRRRSRQGAVAQAPRRTSRASSSRMWSRISVTVPTVERVPVHRLLVDA